MNTYQGHNLCFPLEDSSEAPMAIKPLWTHIILIYLYLGQYNMPQAPLCSTLGFLVRVNGTTYNSRLIGYSLEVIFAAVLFLHMPAKTASVERQLQYLDGDIVGEKVPATPKKIFQFLNLVDTLEAQVAYMKQLIGKVFGGTLPPSDT